MRRDASHSSSHSASASHSPGVVNEPSSWRGGTAISQPATGASCCGKSRLHGLSSRGIRAIIGCWRRLRRSRHRLLFSMPCCRAGCHVVAQVPKPAPAPQAPFCLPCEVRLRRTKQGRAGSFVLTLPATPSSCRAGCHVVAQVPKPAPAPQATFCGADSFVLTLPATPSSCRAGHSPMPRHMSRVARPDCRAGTWLGLPSAGRHPGLNGLGAFARPASAACA